MPVSFVCVWLYLLGAHISLVVDGIFSHFRSCAVLQARVSTSSKAHFEHSTHPPLNPVLLWKKFPSSQPLQTVGEYIVHLLITLKFPSRQFEPSLHL